MLKASPGRGQGGLNGFLRRLKSARGKHQMAGVGGKAPEGMIPVRQA